MIIILTVRSIAAAQAGGTVMAEMTSPDSARLRAAVGGVLTRQERKSEVMAELSEQDGEKLVDGQAVLALQRADGRSRAVE
jgi:hypothetical protein